MGLYKAKGLKSFNIQHSRFPGFAALAALTLALNACDVDNQRIVSVEDQPIANPKPLQTDSLAKNAQHKVLLAVIDSGVDYNHPLLKDHMHYELDSHGVPTRLGYDYVGNDNWPSPYLVRTLMYDPTAEKSDLDADAQIIAGINKVIEAEPELKPYLDPRRAAEEEFSEDAFHGTHVAGLMTYDRQDFGLLAYRILPSNRYGKELDANRDRNAEAIGDIVSAIDQAAKDGAHIVNMSLGLDFQKALAEDGQGAVDAEKKMNSLLAELTAAVKRHPDMLFVAAAGNDGAWADGANRMGMPCGVKAPNMLCVGALRSNGDPATFTNIPLSGVDVVFALGHNVLSTLPTEMCVSQEMARIQAALLDPSAQIDPDAATKLKEECTSSPGMGVLSGTSMASPLVAHAAAEILADHPGLAPAGIVEELYRQAMPDFIGDYPVYKLRIKKPSWYAEYNFGQMNLESLLQMNSGRDDSSDYFEGYMPGGAQ